MGLAMAAIVVSPAPARAAGFDANSAEQQLFNLINQDRAANGKPALQLNASLDNIARGGNISVCSGETVHGRSQDMIERNFFSHQIPSCGAYVWPAISNAGIQYSSAGENIAWNNYSPQSTSVDQANTAFMNSAGHRANILGDYNQVGVGAWMASGPWTGNGNPLNGVIMYTEIFVNAPIVTPPPPPPPTGPSYRYVRDDPTPAPAAAASTSRQARASTRATSSVAPVVSETPPSAPPPGASAGAVEQSSRLAGIELERALQRLYTYLASAGDLPG
ncbi:MAG TPA: CAP domain-containing protein [Candidatus Dormibacteraeota bacterium]|nr:CAP domain-containing protein [Candidatus Dormibacteraeota bacterium]